MANFPRMLAERPEVPKELFFLNHGVKLTSNDSPVLAHMIKIAEGGCQLFDLPNMPGVFKPSGSRGSRVVEAVQRISLDNMI